MFENKGLSFLVQQFDKRTRQCYTSLHTSIATLRRRIVLWRRQGSFLLDYCDTLMEMCNTKKANRWVRSLPTLRHGSMQVLTNVAAQLGRPFPGCCCPSASPPTSVHRLVTLKNPTPKDSTCPTFPNDDSVTSSMVDNDLFHQNVDFLLRFCFLCAWRTAVFTSYVWYVHCPLSLYFMLTQLCFTLRCAFPCL